MVHPPKFSLMLIVPQYKLFDLGIILISATLVIPEAYGTSVLAGVHGASFL